MTDQQALDIIEEVIDEAEFSLQDAYGTGSYDIMLSRIEAMKTIVSQYKKYNKENLYAAFGISEDTQPIGGDGSGCRMWMGYMIKGAIDNLEEEQKGVIMKYQIRKGVFETNSSSMHSLVINKREKGNHEDELKYQIDWIKRYMDKDGYISDEHFEFGRYPFKILAGMFPKIQYAFAAYTINDYHWEGEDFKTECAPEINEIVNLIRDYIPEFQGFRRCYGYVEDCSLTTWLLREGISLTDFIEDDSYIVICDGDEYCFWDDIKDTGIIKEAIKE